MPIEDRTLKNFKNNGLPNAKRMQTIKQ